MRAAVGRHGRFFSLSHSLAFGFGSHPSFRVTPSTRWKPGRRLSCTLRTRTQQQAASAAMHQLVLEPGRRLEVIVAVDRVHNGKVESAAEATVLSVEGAAPDRKLTVKFSEWRHDPDLPIVRLRTHSPLPHTPPRGSSATCPGKTMSSSVRRACRSERRWMCGWSQRAPRRRTLSRRGAQRLWPGVRLI